MGRLIGIAGKMGSGKNYVASRLALRGWYILDMDEIAHAVLDDAAGEVERIFGPGMLTESGKVNRRALGSIVFARPESLRRLEELTYPRIEQAALRRIAEESPGSAAVHAVNLHKTSLPECCEFIIWVKALSLLRFRRVMKRDHLSPAALKARFRSQKGLNPKLFSSRADTYIVGNSGSDRRLDQALDRILGRA